MFVFSLCSDGKLEIVVPSFVHYLEVLDGSDGDKTPGMDSYSSTSTSGVKLNLL